MKDRFFLDTNIFLYSFDRNAPNKARKANQLIRDAITSRKGHVSYQVVQEFLNVALKRFPVPMTVTGAQDYLADVFRPLLTVESSEGLYSEALRVNSRYRLAWYDSLIVASAIQADCSRLYTEDLQHGLELGELRIHNPFR